ncbi:MAG: hypothetical protein L0221_07535 [Chloroflexi bacterium]|nr:hypothetical protein [Chloroflexota bacterium]
MTDSGVRDGNRPFFEALGAWPEPFYRRFGLEPTGEVDDGEVVGRLPL